MCRYLLVLALFLPSIAQAQETSKPARQDVTVRELAALLAEPLETKAFQEKQTLKEALILFQDMYRKKGKELPIQVNLVRFNEENPDAKDTVYETEIKFAEVPRRMSGGRRLRALLAPIPTNNGAYCLKPGLVEITTQESVSPVALLSRMIDVTFARRPLHLALEDLYDQTGVAVVLDSRVGVRARTPITMNFSSEVTLGTALLLMSEVSGLKMIVSDEIIFITTPAIARQFLLERMWNPYRLPDWQNPRDPRTNISAMQAYQRKP